eukprot:gb/GECG01001289.1/.p1 GENE.gb/GECG01001289.1/~~gb/GECG01001289.1/.p1  ORF type:complete len:924 (+),score=151.87 gb/GECG01001289.1/:1-2772(+)
MSTSPQIWRGDAVEQENTTSRNQTPHGLFKSPSPRKHNAQRALQTADANILSPTNDASTITPQKKTAMREQRISNAGRSTDRSKKKKGQKNSQLRRRRAVDSLLSPTTTDHQQKPALPESELAVESLDNAAKMGQQWQVWQGETQAFTQLSSYNSPSTHEQNESSPYARRTPNGTVNVSEKLSRSDECTMQTKGTQCEEQSHEVTCLASRYVSNIIQKCFDDSYVDPKITGGNADDTLRMQEMLMHLENCIWNERQKHTATVEEARHQSAEELNRTKSLLNDQSSRMETLEHDINCAHTEVERLKSQLDESHKRENSTREKHQQLLCKARKLEERPTQLGDSEFVEQGTAPLTHSTANKANSPCGEEFTPVNLESPKSSVHNAAEVDHYQAGIPRAKADFCSPYHPDRNNTVNDVPQKFSKIRSKFRAAKNSMKLRQSRQQELVKEQLSAAQWTMYGLFSQLNEACSDKEWMAKRLEESKEAEKAANDALRRVRAAQAELRARLSTVTKNLNNVAEERDEGWRKVAEVLEQGQRLMQRLETTMKERSILYTELCNCHSATQRLCETLQFSPESSQQSAAADTGSEEVEADSPSETSNCVQIARGVSQRMQDLRDTLISSGQNDTEVAQVWSKESDIVRNGLEAVCDSAVKQRIENAEKETQDARQETEQLRIELGEANASIAELNKAVEQKKEELQQASEKQDKAEKDLEAIKQDYENVLEEFSGLQSASQSLQSTNRTIESDEVQLEDWWCMDFETFSNVVYENQKRSPAVITYSSMPTFPEWDDHWKGNDQWDIFDKSTIAVLRRQWYLAAVQGNLTSTPTRPTGASKWSPYAGSDLSGELGANCCERHIPPISPSASVVKKAFSDLSRVGRESDKELDELFSAAQKESVHQVGNGIHEQEIFGRAWQELQDSLPHHTGTN